jgi:serine/threonine-protein kinase
MVFQEAIELRPQERDAFVADACAGDSALRSEIDSLIASHDDERPFLDTTPVAGTGKMLAAALADVDEDAVPQLAPGARVSDYEIIERLGAGGMGEVYRAYDAKLARFVALKILYDAPGGHTNARILREARAVSALNHPNICTIYEVGNVEGRAYLAMEYVAGQPLNEILPPDGFPPDVVVNYGTQIADALAHAHERGVIHRDLKSANVVVTPQGRAKVLDFGLARRTIAGDGGSRPDTLTDMGNFAGTPAYMAPELLRDRKADARSDIWALGVLLHEMTCGRRPFDGETPFEITSAILRDSASPLPSTVPGFLQSIVSRCLARDTGERFQSASEVGRALEAKAQPTPTIAARFRMVARHRFSRVAAVVALLILTNGAPACREGTSDPEAYALYVRGRSELTSNTADITAAAVNSFKAAIARDPSYAQAYAGLAMASAKMKLFFAKEEEGPAWYAAAHQAAQRAVQLDSNNAETHEGLAAVYRSAEFDWPAVIDESNQALRLKPKLDLPHSYRASAFNHLGLLEQADSEASATMALNPANLREPLRVRGVTAMYGGRYNDAVVFLERAASSQAGNPGEWNLAFAYYNAGRKGEAESMLRKLGNYARSKRRAQASLASFLAARGETAEAKKLVSEVIRAPYTDHHVAYALGVAYAQLGMPVDALQWLGTAHSTGFRCYPWFERDPLLEPMKQVPAFQQFMEDFKRSWQTTKARYEAER